MVRCLPKPNVQLSTKDLTLTREFLRLTGRGIVRFKALDQLVAMDLWPLPHQEKTPEPFSFRDG
jgi:hypothetical protein